MDKDAIPVFLRLFGLHFCLQINILNKFQNFSMLLHRGIMRENFMKESIQAMATWKDFKILAQLGEGAHGIVMKAQEKNSNRIVALKKITVRSNQVITLSILREIKCLQLSEHPNIVSLLHVFTHGSSFVLCFEFVERDLASILKSTPFRLPSSYIRGWMYMLLSGVSYIHSMEMIHRDLKPANLLINTSGILKISDFGQARMLFSEQEKRPMSHQVATRWYRAPELLYGSREYTTSVDIWAIGCIFGEMLCHFPLFPGQNDIDQLHIVLSTLGTPGISEWPEMLDLPDYPKIFFPDFHSKPFPEIIPDAPDDSLDLISKMLVYNGKRRIAANAALCHEFFRKWKGFDESALGRTDMQNFSQTFSE